MVGYDPKRNPKFTSFDYTLAGAMSGFITRGLFQPFDVVKIRFQLQVEPISKSAGQSKYKSLSQCVKCIVKEEGVKALWKGHVPAQYLSIVYGAVQFWSYEAATKTVYSSRSELKNDKFLVNFGCGAFAGGVASFTSLPFDVVRTHLVAQGKDKVLNNFRHSFGYIYKQAGFKAFYRGLSPSLIQILPHAGFQFSFNRLANHVWCSAFPSSSVTEPTAIQSFFCGGVAGTCAKTLVYPLDLAKKRLQIQGFGQIRKNFGVTMSYKGFFNCLLIIIKTEGPTGLFKGLTPSLLKAFITTASHFLFYDQSLKAILWAKS
ncbi:mitochondrial thiamine pyrophosphate carrier [Tetranychus urticae]|uniref:Mitochondrial thiamine pyrophosphate carrier n=1 Tax=Tetranychus urticae TaxID=32264 RepID=T1K594_TETUR|nr:mitochondrial thiamine pyrophosphate carrier [Tetranychus urticae]